ncbi:MAG: M20/M25/M40 family metallo-hydrolase, partial [Verrucomicrobiales bacterium]|nr:M20/M25/M40 family metallo-hydrolase [Verrucomicrobiales bacterium]
MIDWIRDALPPSRQTQLRDTLIEWCEINSGSCNLEGLSKMHDRLRDEFCSLADTTESIPLQPCRKYDDNGRAFDLELGNVLRFRKRPTAPFQVLLSGHYDTVYGPEHPFQKCEILEDGRILRGPGVTDMKGGLLVMRESLRLLEEHPEKDSIGWEVILNPEEEIGTPGARDILRQGAARCQIGLVFECSTMTGQLVRRRLGTGFFLAEVTGRSAHAGRDQSEGRNAIEALSGLILSLRELRNEMDEVIINVARFHSAAPLNAVPDHAVAQLNIRVASPGIGTEVKDRIAKLVSEVEKEYEVQIKWRGDFDRPPRIPDASVQKMENLMEDCFSDLD